MTSQADLDRQLHSLLRDGPTELPEASFYAVRERIEARHQRVFIGPWRIPTVSKLVPVGLGAAAVIAAVFVGARLLGSPDPGVGGPGLSPSPTPVASVAAPSPQPSGDAEPAGLIPFGEFRMYDPKVAPPPWNDGPPITLTFHQDTHRWLFHPEFMAFASYNEETGLDDSDPPDGAGMIAFSTSGAISVYGDPCKWDSTRPETPASTVDEIVAALAAQPSRNASEPVDVTVGGHAGKSIILHVPDGAASTDCNGSRYASFEAAGDPAGPARYHQGPGQIDELWIIDVDGAIVIIDAMYGPETDPDLIDDLRMIAASATFE